MKFSQNKNVFNLLSLAGIQGANALFPLAVFPYLLSVLGYEEFSIVVVCEAVTLYMLAVCLYSFDVTAVKEIISSDAGEDGVDEPTVFWNVLCTRLILFAVVAIVGLFISYSYYSKYFYPLLAWLMFPLGMILQNNYYFQAKESNLRLSIFVLLSRLSACLTIYLLIASSDDMLLSISILAGSFLLSGIASLISIASSITFRYSMISKKSIARLLEQGFMIFLGNISVSLFRGSNVIILSLVGGGSIRVPLFSCRENSKKYTGVGAPIKSISLS